MFVGCPLYTTLVKLKTTPVLGNKYLLRQKKTATIRKGNGEVRAVMSVQKDFVCVYQTLKALK